MVNDVKVSSSSRRGSRAGGIALRPRIKVWVQAENGFGFGSRFIAILEAVHRTGSIKHAAAEQGWSYRHVWSRIKRAEAALDFALVTTQLGGAGKDRSELTPEARQIVSRFHEWRTRLLNLASRDPDFADP
jgi:molybdate transport system regulatory protein